MAFAISSHRDELRLAEVNTYADSFCTNAHKWGLVGFDCCEYTRIPVKAANLTSSALFYVRDRTDLTEAFDVTPVSSTTSVSSEPRSRRFYERKKAIVAQSSIIETGK